MPPLLLLLLLALQARISRLRRRQRHCAQTANMSLAHRAATAKVFHRRQLVDDDDDDVVGANMGRAIERVAIINP